MGLIILYVDCWENKVVVWFLDEDGFFFTKIFVVLEDFVLLCVLDEEEVFFNIIFVVVVFFLLLSLDGLVVFLVRGILVGRDLYNLVFFLNKFIVFIVSSFFDFF